MDSSDWVRISFFVALGAATAAKMWLDARNRRHVLSHRHQVPQDFRDKITLQDHQKAADYTIAKLNTERYFDVVDLVLLLGWTVGGGIQLLAGWIQPWGYGPVLSGVIFFALYSAIGTVLSLPQSLYNTFVVEEKFGFNKMTPALFIKDMLKGLLVGALLGLPILAGVIPTDRLAGRQLVAGGMGLYHRHSIRPAVGLSPLYRPPFQHLHSHGRRGGQGEGPLAAAKNRFHFQRPVCHERLHPLLPRQRLFHRFRQKQTHRLLRHPSQISSLRIK